MPDSVAAPRRHHVTSSDGVQIGCYVEGEGPPLLMVHGVAIDHSCFDRARPELAKHFTLYLMDRRGRGISGDAETWSLEQEFDDVVAVLNSFDRPINVFGHSLGGLCVLEAVARTDKTRKLFLYDPAIPLGPRPSGILAVAAKLEEILRTTGDREKMIVTHLTEWTGLKPEQVERQKRDADRWARRLGWAHTIPREYRGTQAFKADVSRFAKISVPTRILIGEQSHGGLQTSAKTVLETIEGSDLVTFKGAGHYGFNSAPASFVAEVVRFFEED